LRKERRSKKSSAGGFSYEDFAFKRAKIEKVTNESSNVKSFYLRASSPRIPQPGQFVMVWLPGAEDVPMSVSGAGKNTVRVSVSKEGSTTAKFHGLGRGDSLFLRGPFGNGFSLEGSHHLLVAGGYGAAPLIHALKILSDSGKKAAYAVGAKDASELLFVREARRLGASVSVATEDGSAGYKGLVTDLLEEILAEKHFGSILTCGPEKMMLEVVRKGLELDIPVQASLERYMKCGFGACGSCVLDPLGLRVCLDGPVFDGTILLKTEFGRYKRDASGARVPIGG